MNLRGGVVKFVEGDGAVGEEEVTGWEAGEWGAAEVHDHLHQRWELRVALDPPPQLPREQLQEPFQLLLEPLRPRSRRSISLRGAQHGRSAAPAAAGAAGREGAGGEWAWRDGGGEVARGGEREMGDVEEAEVEWRRRRHDGGREHERRERACGWVDSWRRHKGFFHANLRPTRERLV